MEWFSQSGCVFKVFFVEQVVGIESQCNLPVDRIKDACVDDVACRFVHIVLTSL